MQTGAIADKYAKALFAAAQDAGRVQKVAADMASLLRLRDEDPAFLNFLVSPEVGPEHKTAFILTVFGPRLDPLAVNFLRLLIDKGRIKLLAHTCGEFRRLTEEYRGLMRARVVSAAALDGEQEARIKRELDRITGKDVILDRHVDPALLGGVVVHLGTKIIDRSLRRGLKELSDSLLRAELS